MEKFIAEVKTKMSKITILVKKYDSEPSIVVQKINSQKNPLYCTGFKIPSWGKNDLIYHVKLISSLAHLMVRHHEDLQDALNVIVYKVMPLYYKYLKCSSLVNYVPENVPDFLKSILHTYSYLYTYECNVRYHLEEYQADPENYWSWDEINGEIKNCQEYEEEVKEILGNELFKEFEEFIKIIGEPYIYNFYEFEIYFMYYLSGLWGEVK